MSVEIESATIGAVTEKRLVLSNSQWAATLSLGTNWNIIRIGARLALDDTEGDIGGTPRFYMGVTSSPASGFTNGPLSGAATKHFIGMVTSDTSWSHAALTPHGYVSIGSQIAKKVASAITTDGGSAEMRFCAAPTTARQITMVEIEKGSPNFTVRVSVNSSGSPTEHSLTQLLTAMDNPTMSSAVTPLAQAVSTGTVATDESVDGFFNAIAIAWDRSAAKFHISEMFFAKYA